MPLGFVPGGLSGPPWGTFWFWSGLTKSLLVHVTQCSTKKNQKFKKVATTRPSFFYKEGRVVAGFWDWRALVVEHSVIAGWMG